MRIAIDAMGGDYAPAAVVRGAIEAAREWSDLDIILVGNQERMAPFLDGAPANVRVKHASEVIEAFDEPVKAVRRKKDASMVVAAQMVKEGEAEGMISAGNTGALMAAGLLIIGRIPGIDRPALAPIIPTVDGRGVLALDLGANMDATPEHLLQYAIMGYIYRQKMHGLEAPKVGLLNVGTEEMKGNELTKAAFALLSQAPIHFIGNVEARDVLNRNCDVLVCDGFVGNILLKAMEGAAETMFSALKAEFTSTPWMKLAALVLKPRLKKLKTKFDYTEHGGAPLLGVNGVCIKGHGSSDANAVKNAVRQARIAIMSRLVDSISVEINRK